MSFLKRTLKAWISLGILPNIERRNNTKFTKLFPGNKQKNKINIPKLILSSQNNADNTIKGITSTVN